MKQTSPAPMRHTISVLVENSFRVLTRVAGFFSGRGFISIRSTCGPTQREKTSHLTMVVRGDSRVLDQVTRQLNKVVDVIESSRTPKRVNAWIGS